jgi:hypothetical protein
MPGKPAYSGESLSRKRSGGSADRRKPACKRRANYLKPKEIRRPGRLPQPVF